MCDCADAVDFMINAPVLKGHCQTKITCALKNMKGLIPNAEKRRFHQMGLHRPIAHLAAGIRQDFIVVDHICGDLDFEDGGNPVVRNQIWTAADPVLADAWVCHMMGYEKKTFPILAWRKSWARAAATGGRRRSTNTKPGNCPRWISRTSLCQKAEKWWSFRTRWRKWSPAVPATAICSRLDRLREEGLLSKLDTKICIGQGYKKQSGRLGIGNCARGFSRNLPGCPPMPDEIYDFLKEYLLTL